MKKLVFVLVIMVVALAAALSGCTSAAENLEENKYGVTQLSDDCYQFVSDKYYGIVKVYYNVEENGEYNLLPFNNIYFQFVNKETDRTFYYLYKNDILRIKSSYYLDEIYSIKIVSEYDENTYYIYYVQTGEYEAS